MKKQNTKLLNYIHSSIGMILMISVFGLNAFPFSAAQQPISGIGFFAVPGECTDPAGNGSDFALTMTGDLQGCLYVFVEDARCTPSGVYLETGTETFVGTYGGGFGTFRTTYKVQAKYKDCSNLTGQIFGGCQHPIVSGSGTGTFEGVRGRFNMKDDVEEANLQYKGHLFW